MSTFSLTNFNEIFLFTLCYNIKSQNDYLRGIALVKTILISCYGDGCFVYFFLYSTLNILIY